MCRLGNWKCHVRRGESRCFVLTEEELENFKKIPLISNLIVLGLDCFAKMSENTSKRKNDEVEEEPSKKLCDKAEDLTDEKNKAENGDNDDEVNDSDLELLAEDEEEEDEDKVGDEEGDSEDEEDEEEEGEFAEFINNVMSFWRQLLSLFY